MTSRLGDLKLTPPPVGPPHPKRKPKDPTAAGANGKSTTPQTTQEAPAKAKATNPAPHGALALLRTDRGLVQPCEHNAFVLLAAEPRYTGLHFDDFLSRMRLGDRDWLDADDLDALRWLQSSQHVARFAMTHARNGARSLAYERRCDSLRDFVRGLKPWDGTPRIEQAFGYAWGAPDTALMRAASSNFFVAMIARALLPGAQVDTLWVFEGPQGTFKSRALRALGGSLHAEISAAIGTIDFQRELRGIWLAEMSELDSLRGREASTVKRLLSAPSDRFVQKYALHAESYPRRAIAVATTNECAYWQDPTGARRLVPIPCGVIRCHLIEVNRLEWFAEAKHAYHQGATWWEFPSDIEAAQEDRQQADPWEDIVREALARSIACKSWKGQIASAAVARDWLDLAPHQQGAAVGPRLGRVMRRVGFAPIRMGHTRERGWQLADTAGQQEIDVSA